MDAVIEIYCGPTLLADGTGSGGRVEELTLNGVRVIQEGQPLRADWIVLFGRGNRKNTISMVITQQFATLLAALQAALQANDNLPVTADLVLNYTDPTGPGISCLIPGAGWNPIEAKPKGLSATFKFTAFGGQWQVTAGVGVPGIDGGPFDAPDFELVEGWPIDGGNFADREQQAGYLIDAGSF
jgi:hypothetical protein